MYLVLLMKDPRDSFRTERVPADEPEPSENLWLDLAGFGEAGVSVEPGEIDEDVYES